MKTIKQPIVVGKISKSSLDKLIGLGYIVIIRESKVCN